MQDKWVYEYAVIRLVPKVERCEFVNTGLIMLCKSRRYIRIQYEINDGRICALYKDVDLETVQSYLEAFRRIALGEKGSGEIGQLAVHERFRWLTAKRSTVLQCSPVHGGISGNLDATFDKMYREYVASDRC